MIVALGQSAWVPLLAPLAAAFGYALFWNKERRFWPATFWFTAVQLVQISWLATPDYMPSLMILVYLLLAFAMGLQFGAITLLTHRPLALAGGWVLMEWLRLYLFTGFPWNPVGLSLAANPYSIQFASIFGVYGLSFWVILVNALALHKKILPWALCALLPYGFGFVQELVVERIHPSSQHISVALVQTGLLPDQKMPLKEYPGAFIPALVQWERVCHVLKPEKPVELIVFPEAAFPFEVNGAYHSLREVNAIFGVQTPSKEKGRVTNGWIAQKLADRFGAQVIAGFDDYEPKRAYNAAFSFLPGKTKPERYEKRILMPIAEYVPSIVSGFLSIPSFDAGITPTVFSSKDPLEVSIGVSICSDEAYSHLVREQRLQGAELLVSISNDGWYPHSRLSRQHFEQGRLRAAENGAPLVRSCNTGITGGIDCFGKSIGELAHEELGVLYLDVPLRSFPTLYTWWGDRTILLLSLLCLLLL